LLLRVIDRHDALTSDCKARLPDKPGKRFILTGDCRDLCQRFLGVHRTRKHLQGIARCASRSFYAAPQCHRVRACAPTPEAQNQAASWYNNGTEVIFAAGGAVGNSVMAAAEAAGTKVIGVDVDQSGESETVITSAMKGLGTSVYDMIAAYYNGSFPGGENKVYDAANNGVALAMDTAKFDSFAKADYDTLFAALQNNTNNIASDILKNVDADNNEIALTDIPVKAVVVTEVK